MRSEGCLFNSGGLGIYAALIATRCCCSDRNRLQASATVRGRSAMALTLGEAFGEGFGWKHDAADSCEIARKRVEKVRGWRMSSLRRRGIL